MKAFHLSSDGCRKILAGKSILTGMMTALILMALALCAGAAEETFMESEGEIFTVVKGKAGTHCTGKITSITDTQIEIKDKEANRKTYIIGKTTQICDRRNKPIRVKDFTVGELVTIATSDDAKGNATGIRKGPILIRLTNMQPVPIGK